MADPPRGGARPRSSYWDISRIIMAPLTRMCAANPGHAPTELHAEYYVERAFAGLIIGECTVSARMLTAGLTPLRYGAPGNFGDRGR